MEKKLLKHLSERNITINKLSKMTGIYPSDLYRTIKGKHTMWYSWKKRIADALEVDAKELFEEKETNHGN